MADFGDFQPKQVSVYNDAQLQTFSWNESREKCKALRRGGLLVEWQFEMEQMWDNIWAKAKKQGADSCIKDIETADGAVATASVMFKQDPHGKRGAYYSALRKKYQLLDYTREVLGMGTRFRDNDENEMDA